MKKKKHLDTKQENEEIFSIHGFSELQWYVVLVSVITALLLGWSSMMSMLGFGVSFSNILYLHNYLFTWLFDGFVITIVMAFLYLANFKKFKIRQLEKENDKLQEEIKGSIVIADDIREGHAIDNNTVAESELGKTLLNLGQSLHDTREKEAQFNWVSKGKEQISDIIRVHNKIEDLADATLKGIVQYYKAVQAAFYILNGETLSTVSQYAYDRKRYEKEQFKIGYGLIGACAYEKELIYRTDIPSGYFSITSGMLDNNGKPIEPNSIIIIPLKQESNVEGVVEISFFEKSLPDHYFNLADEIGNMLGSTIYNLKINMQTEKLLRESQEMTATLKANEEQLNKNAEEMRNAQRNLEKSNAELADKINEINAGQKKQEAMLSNASEFISIYVPDPEYDLEKDKDKKDQMLPVKVIFESPSMKSILGIKEGTDVHGMDVEYMMPPSFRKVRKMFVDLLETPGGEQTIEYPYLKNDTKIFLETSGKNLLHDPAVNGIICNTRDITERKEREREEKRTGRMKSLSENSPDIIIRSSLGSRPKIQYYNPAAAKFLVINNSQEVIDRPFIDFIVNEELKDFVSGVLRRIKSTQRQESVDLMIPLANGEDHYYEVRAIPEFDENEGSKKDDNKKDVNKKDDIIKDGSQKDGNNNGPKVDSVLFTIHDVTEIKKLEQEARKLEQEATEAKKRVDESTNYGKRIQFALLPDEARLQELFPKSFMFYRPKMIVSGDFPWIYHKEGDRYTYVAVVDCTGHGVPGALLSIIGDLLLTKIVEKDPTLDPAEVLNQLHAEVRIALKQATSDANAGDGMDMGLIRIDPRAHEIAYAGAHRPLYYLKKTDSKEFVFEDVFQEIEGTRKGIGGKPLPNGKKERNFESTVKEFNEGDRIFVFSDGLPDQLGGEEHKKFFTRRIKEWLQRNVNESMVATASDLTKTFYEWMGNDKQVDDVLLIGIELHETDVTPIAEE